LICRSNWKRARPWRRWADCVLKNQIDYRWSLPAWATSAPVAAVAAGATTFSRGGRGPPHAAAPGNLTANVLPLPGSLRSRGAAWCRSGHASRSQVQACSAFARERERSTPVRNARSSAAHVRR